MGFHKIPITAAHCNPRPTRVDGALLEALIKVVIAMHVSIDGDPDLDEDRHEPDRDDSMYQLFVNGRWHWGHPRA